VGDRSDQPAQLVDGRGRPAPEQAAGEHVLRHVQTDRDLDVGTGLATDMSQQRGLRRRSRQAMQHPAAIVGRRRGETRLERCDHALVIAGVIQEGRRRVA
jgi:hypothetical protein